MKGGCFLTNRPFYQGCALATAIKNRLEPPFTAEPANDSGLRPVSSGHERQPVKQPTSDRRQQHSNRRSPAPDRVPAAVSAWARRPAKAAKGLNDHNDPQHQRRNRKAQMDNQAKARRAGPFMGRIK